MKTPYQVLEPYLWDDPEGGQNVCDGDALTAMKEYAEIYHQFMVKKYNKKIDKIKDLLIIPSVDEHPEIAINNMKILNILNRF